MTVAVAACVETPSDTGGPAPIKARRRAIARQRIEVVVDEFRSTITHTQVVPQRLRHCHY